MQLRSASHAKLMNLSDSNKVAKEHSLNNPSISMLPLPPHILPSILHHFLVQNDPDLVTATKALSNPSPNLTPPPSSGNDLTTDYVVANHVPIPKTSCTKA